MAMVIGRTLLDQSTKDQSIWKYRGERKDINQDIKFG